MSIVWKNKKNNNQTTHSMETKQTTKQQRGFACIASPDERYTCGFALSGHMDFVDAVDRLFYVRVDRAQTIDDDLSNLYLTCLQAPMGCMEQLLVDLPELMEEHLGNE